MPGEQMKEHLYKLLLEQHNQEVLFDEFLEKGIDLHAICIDNLEIIFDIISFPEDNAYDYHLYENPRPESTVKFPKPDDPLFDHDWLREEYIFVLGRIAKEENMFVIEDSLETVYGADEKGTERKLRDYIDWLYKEKRNWKRRKIKPHE